MSNPFVLLVVPIAISILALGCAKPTRTLAPIVAPATQNPPVAAAVTPESSPRDASGSPSSPDVKINTAVKDAQIAALQKALAEREAQISDLKQRMRVHHPEHAADAQPDGTNDTATPDTPSISPERALKVKLQKFISHYVFSNPSKAITVENAAVRDVRVINVKSNPSPVTPFAVYTYVFLTFTPGTDEYNRAPMGTREQYVYLCNPDTREVGSVKTF